MDGNLIKMRVYVTENCNAKCSSCFNANSRSNAEMSPDVFEELCGYLCTNGIKSLKIMGGEPTVHKDFLQIIAIAKEFFPRIAIFTNALKENIQKVELREHDSIIYNFNFASVFTEDTFVLQQPGYRALEVQVRAGTDEKKLFQKLLNVLELGKGRLTTSFTLDCTSNILQSKSVLSQKLKFLTESFRNHDLFYDFDHTLPLCFLYKTGVNVGKNDGLCHFKDCGLIDASLNLRFCNQYPDKLICLKQNGRFIPWSIVKNRLMLKFLQNQIAVLSKACKDCIFYGGKCNGGCWMGKDLLSENDVYEFSGFPVTTKEKETIKPNT